MAVKYATNSKINHTDFMYVGALQSPVPITDAGGGQRDGTWNTVLTTRVSLTKYSSQRQDDAGRLLFAKYFKLTCHYQALFSTPTKFTVDYTWLIRGVRYRIQDGGRVEGLPMFYEFLVTREDA